MNKILFILLATFTLSVYGQQRIVDMSEPTLSSESAYFEGRIIKSDSSYTDSVRIYVFDLLEEEGYTDYAKLDSTGSFSFEIQCGSSVSLNFFHGNLYEGFLLVEPGSTSTLILDEGKKSGVDRWRFSGAHSDWNNGMNSLPDSTRFYSLYRKVAGAWKEYTDDEDEFEFIGKLSPMQSALEERIWQSDVSDEVKSFNYLASKLYYIELLSGYAMTLNQLSLHRGLDRGVSGMFYRDAVKENILKYNSMLYTPMGSQLKRYSALCNEQRGAHFSYPKFLDKIDYGRRALHLINEGKPLNERQFSAISEKLPELYMLIAGRNEALRLSLLNSLRNPMYHIRYIDEDVKGKDVYFSLVDNYAGKIVLMDLWATWCMPCRIAMENMKPLKEEFGDSISFVYVTGETSSEDTWRSLIPDIKGEHYYLTDSQWKELCKHLKVKSIPSYLLIDWDGLVVKQFTGYPGIDPMRKEIDKLLIEHRDSLSQTGN